MGANPTAYTNLNANVDESETSRSERLKSVCPWGCNSLRWYHFMKGRKKCKRCNVYLEIGKAIDFIDPSLLIEYTPYSKGKLIVCWKCPKCGHSET